MVLARAIGLHWGETPEQAEPTPSLQGTLALPPFPLLPGLLPPWPFSGEEDLGASDSLPEVSPTTAILKATREQ